MMLPLIVYHNPSSSLKRLWFIVTHHNTYLIIQTYTLLQAISFFPGYFLYWYQTNLCLITNKYIITGQEDQVNATRIATSFHRGTVWCQIWQTTTAHCNASSEVDGEDDCTFTDMKLYRGGCMSILRNQCHGHNIQIFT